MNFRFCSKLAGVDFDILPFSCKSSRKTDSLLIPEDEEFDVFESLHTVVPAHSDNNNVDHSKETGLKQKHEDISQKIRKFEKLKVMFFIKQYTNSIIF